VDLTGPIIVGGMGGSGTRVVADLLQRKRVFIGFAKNVALDNLMFTLLFKRTTWLSRQLARESEFKVELATHEKLLLGKRLLSPTEYFFLACTVWDWLWNSTLADGLDRGWAKRIIKQQLLRFGQKPDQGMWGWKEPNSHLLLPQILAAYPRSKYVHVVRNAIDMSLSGNRQQLENWKHFLLGKEADNVENIESLMLKCWLAVNDRVANEQKTVGKDRVLMLSYDELCANPQELIPILLDFLDIPYSQGDIEELMTAVDAPDTIGRSHGIDYSVFDPNDLARAKAYETPNLSST
jgi:hypothetical protein